MHKFNYLTKALVLAAAVLLGHPDTARAQLFFNPNPVQLTIGAPGGSAGPSSVSVSANTQINSLSISNINTASGGNWLCAVPSGTNTVNVFIGSGNCSVAATTTQLAPNQNYTGTITVQGNGGVLSGTITVNLGVGTSGGGGGSGVTAFPSSVTFNATPGGQVPAQNVQVTVNGSPQAITFINFTPTSGFAFLNTTFSGSTATLSVTSTNVGAGVYTGTLTLNTVFGSVNVPVTLSIVVGGGSGVVATPSSVTFFATSNGPVNPQNVTVTVNGSATSINSATFSPTSGGVAFINTSINGSTATLTVNTTNLANGVYTGTETLNTVFGSVNVPVTLTIGSGTSNIVANPNPVNFTVQTGGSAPTQNVLLTLNGSPTDVRGATATTTTGQTWLLPTVSGNVGTVIVGVNASGLSAGSYTGTVTATTLQGTASFQVNLTVGGTPTLQVNPTSLNFAYQVGTSIPASQTVAITTTGSPINYSVTSFTNSGGTQWMIVSPLGQGQTPGTLTVSVQPIGLQPGNTYTGTIQITTFGGSSNPVVNIPVSLLVSNNPILTATPTAINFTAQQGSTPPAQILTLQSSSSPLNFNISGTVTTPAGFNWLQVPTQFGVTPGTIPVNVITSGLAPGTYTGVVNISAGNAGNPTVSVPVTLVITAGSVLQLTPASLSFAYQLGQAQPQSQTVTVGSPSGQVGYTVAATQVSSGPTWLSVSSTTGLAPGSFAVAANTSGLTPGVYTGTITVTPTNGAAQTIPVTLVMSPTALLVATPSSISFTAQPATATTPATVSPSFQNLAVTSTDGTQITFNVNVTYSTGGAGWLFVNTSTGITPSNLSITANPSNLGIGTYAATITLTATSPASVANSPQVINVTMTVAPSISLTASPASLSFTQSVSGVSPAPQTLTVSGAGQTPFTAFATTSQGGPWLSVSPTNGTTPATLTVLVNGIVNGFPLQPGTYQGQITISSAGSANPVTVPVTLTVGSPTGGLTNAGSIAHLASAGLWKTIITLFNTGTVSSQARLNFYDDNGNPLALPLSFPQSSSIPQAPVSTLERTLAPGATLIIESTGPDNQVTQTGWAQLLSSGNINGFSVFRQSGSFGQHEAVVPLETRNAGSYLLAFDNTSGFVTGVALALAGSAGNIGVTIRDDNGVLLQSNTISLPSQGHTSFDLANRFPVTAQRRGTIEFQTTVFGGNISVLGIRFNPAGTFSTVPPAAK